MKTMVRRTVLLGALSAVLMQVGCGTAVKQAYYEFRGAKGEVMLVESVPNNVLDRYQDIQFSPVETTLPSKFLSSSAKTAYDDRFVEKRDLLGDQYPGGEPRLYISSDVQFCEGKGILGSALMLTRVKMHDGSRLVVDAIVMAKSKAFREGKADDLAEASADALIDLLLKAKTEEDGINDSSLLDIVK